MLKKRARQAKAQSERAKAKRAEKRKTITLIESNGHSYRMCYDCENQSPVLLSADKIPEQLYPPALAVDIAKLEGRFNLHVTDHPQGIHRFRYRSNKKYISRPYRFLCSDIQSNFGGLDMSASIVRDIPARRRTHSMKSWQMKDPDDMIEATSHREFVSFPKRQFDSREQHWLSMRASEDRQSQGAQRAPVELVNQTEKTPVPDHPDFNPNPKRFRVF
jgi:hypothetical protein